VRQAASRTLEVCKNIARLSFEGAEGKRFGVHVTVGIAQMATPDDTLKALIDRADCALYHGKQNGRNQVVVWRGLDGFVSLTGQDDLDKVVL